MKSDFLSVFNNLENNLVHEQKRFSIKSCLKVYYGITAENKYRISFISSVNPPDFESTKVLKVTQGQESKNVYWTCFDLIDDDAKEVFFIFCNSLVETIVNKEDENEALNSIKNRYYSWRLLLKNNGKMSYEIYQGLFGELFFINEFLIEKYGVKKAIESWVGPDGYSKDFSINDTWFEIKTIGTSSNSVTIHSLDQLDSKFNGHLVVIVVEKMSEQYNNGQYCVSQLYHSIIEKINDNQIREIFINKVLNYGYVDDEIIDNHIFEVKRKNCYLVNDDFPRLTKDTIMSDAISQVSYDIMINSIKGYEEIL